MNISPQLTFNFDVDFNHCPECGSLCDIHTSKRGITDYICPKCNAMITRDNQNADDTKKDEDARQAVIKAWNTRYQEE